MTTPKATEVQVPSTLSAILVRPERARKLDKLFVNLIEHQLDSDSELRRGLTTDLALDIAELKKTAKLKTKRKKEINNCFSINLGYRSYLLAEIFFQVIQNDQKNYFTLMQKMDFRTWHTLLIWFSQSLRNNFFVMKFQRLLISLFLSQSSDYCMMLLFKLGALSCFYQIYQQIYQNGVMLKKYKIREVYLAIRNITKAIHHAIINRSNFEELGLTLARSTIYKELIKHYAPTKAGIYKTMLKDWHQS